MAAKEFKAESKRLLDLMIHSIYTHKEIFLRELISNASDAVDKLYFRSLTDDSVALKKDDFCIRISVDRDARTLTISDNGIGMSKEDLEENLGTIAKSGSFEFKKEHEKTDDVDVIGQFGVGFYSAFMVASKVTVVSRAFGTQEAWCWESEGAEGYTVTPCEKATAGTAITLVIKPDTEEEHYDEFLDENRLAGIVKKYSDYIRYPIRMLREKRRPIEGTDKDEQGNFKMPEYETYTEDETLNSMVPLWKRAKSDVSDEEEAAFYQEKFGDWNKPAKVIRSKTEGTATYTAMLFIPSRAPFNYYTKEYEKGLQLYASGVLIMDKCADLLPDYFSFVRGLVDSQDLSLNISREMLQHDHQLLFYSAKKESIVTLREYVDAMPEDQKYIYYAAGESTEKLSKLPAAENILDKGFDILYLTQDVDEFALQMIREYDKKEFRNISGDDLGLESETEKEEIEAANEAHKELFAAMKEALGDKVAEVKLSQRLKSHPVCLSTSGALSIEMEKVLNNMPTGEKVSSRKILEINKNHKVFASLEKAFAAGDKEKVAAYTNLLYAQALLIEGLPIEDPVAYANEVCELMQ